MQALLRASGKQATDEEVIKHVIVERWRNVERPLDHEQRMYKVGRRLEDEEVIRWEGG